MDRSKKQQAGKYNAQARTTTIIPASRLPAKRLALKIRKRGLTSAYKTTSLLISNSLGVWSVRHRLYFKKTRLHRFCLLKADALPAERRYAALRKLGMHSWPEYDEQVAALRSRLVDIYWDAAPEWYREDVVDYYRKARRRRMRRLVWRPLRHRPAVSDASALKMLKKLHNVWRM